MDTNNNEKQLSMAERRKKGLLWVDTGENMNQQVFARGLCQDFNQTRPTETEKRMEIWKQLFASCGENIWIEPPLTLAMGNTVTIGDGTYINSNLTLVDDYEIAIGKNVLIAPNVTISTTNHPLHYKARSHGEMYCKKVTIEDNVWIGSNVVICAGVTIGMGSVIGAGSVVTRSIPPTSFAAGVPCKVIREITEDDLNEFEPIPE
ncbi:MAG: sugar O-acetyltransferase [Bacillota bacterium]|nr:sugar O-acetyltransferase [Bacillota bacterium]